MPQISTDPKPAHAYRDPEQAEAALSIYDFLFTGEMFEHVHPEDRELVLLSIMARCEMALAALAQNSPDQPERSHQ